jgi:hypothetical protein
MTERRNSPRASKLVTRLLVVGSRVIFKNCDANGALGAEFMSDKKTKARRAAKKTTKSRNKPKRLHPQRPSKGVRSTRVPLASTDLSSPEAKVSPESKSNQRIVQVELKPPLRRIPVRTKSPSPFRFKTSTGRHIPGLHDILNRHALREAHSSFRLRHPRQRRRRSQREKDHFSRFVDLHFPGDADAESILRDLRELPQVLRAIEVSGVIPAASSMDPLVGRNDQLGTDPNTGYELQWYLYRCGVNHAWASASGKNVVIADIDSGFYLQHQDLVANVESVHVYNAVDGTQDVTAGLDTKHGTGVLGIAGGSSNGVGIAGFAFDARLWPIQTDASNSPALPGNPVANAIDWVVGEDPAGRRVVINVEVQTANGGNCEQWPAVSAAIENAIGNGFVVCVAAGNGDNDAGLADDGTAFAPTGSILVGATAYDDAQNPRATGGDGASNWGTTIIVSAPGDASHDITCSDSGTNIYRSLGGTSGAVAKIAGTAALMLEANPNLTHDEMKSILVSTGSPLNTDKPIGVFLNAGAAVSAALASRTT